MNTYTEKLRTEIYNIHPLSNTCWNEFAELWMLHTLESTDFYSKEGDGFKQVSFLCSGVLRAYYTDDQGNEWNEHFFTENGFVTSGVSPELKNVVTIQALTKTVMLSIPYEKFVEFSENHAEINVFVQKLSFKCIETRQRRELLLQSQDATSRYLHFQETFPKLELQIPDYHIASYIGTSATQLSRLKKNLKTQLHL